MLKKITVMGEEQFLAAYPSLKDQPNTCFISIQNPDTYEGDFFKAGPDRMTSVFYDIPYDIGPTKYSPALKAITEEQADELYRFIRDNYFQEHFVIHCTAGISRSAAVAEVVLDMFGTLSGYTRTQFEKDVKNIFPNLYVKGMIYKSMIKETQQKHGYKNL